MKTYITVEYEVNADDDVPVDVIVSAVVNSPFKLVLLTPEGKEREVLATPVLGYPQSLPA